MERNKNLVSLVAALALLILSIGSVSAFASISSVEVSGVDTLSGNNFAVFAGKTIPVRVTITAAQNAEDVRVKAWISGSEDYSVSSERFDVIAGNVYSRFMTIEIPSDVDPDEPMKLEVSVEDRAHGEVASKQIALTAQRESYVVEILDVQMSSTVQAGDPLALDLVLKNKGRKLAEDTFVKVSVPALGIEQKAYFGDLSPVDQADPDKEDAVAGRMYINVPSNTPAGVYALEIEAFNDDASTELSKKFAVVGAIGSTKVVQSTGSKTFAAGETAEYKVTLVNSGRNVMVYELNVDAPTDLSVEADEPFTVVQAGSSKTIAVKAKASKAGKYNFSVSVSADGNLVKKESFVANVEGKSAGVTGTTLNNTVVLTVVLAVIFVVLLVVLIVLLTRKPQKPEEFGESYY